MNKLYIIYIAFVGMIFASCEKYLEVDPANVKSISTIEDVRGIMGGYLLTVKEPKYHMNGSGNPYQYNWYGMSFFPSGSVTRMFYYYDGSLDHLDYANKYVGESSINDYVKGMRWNMRDVHKDIWDNAYRSIGFTNSVITELGNVSGSKEDIERIGGEAKVIRCWHAFKLLQYFAPYSDNNIGIPLNFNSEAVASCSGARKNQSEIYKVIIQELQEVLEYTAPTDADYNIFYNKHIINAILAKIYMYKAEGAVKEEGDWTKAREYALEAMKGRSLATTSEEINTMFKSDEAVFINDNPYCLFLSFSGGKGKKDIIMQWGYPQYAYDWEEPVYGGPLLNTDLFESYSDTDIRVQDGVYLYDRIHFEIGKYIQDGYSVREIQPLFRNADLHLIIAESYVREGDNDKALEWLTDFKDARNAGDFSGGDVLAEILLERWKEFVFEFDYRWIDMKRNKMTLKHIYKDPEKEGNQEDVLEADDYRYNFYIPDSELSINKQIKQNNGWKASGI